MNQQKLKVLCLHGYRQNAAIFREKSGSFRKLLKKDIEFVFITAPHVVLPLDDSKEDSDPGNGWWFSAPQKYFKATHESDYSEGLEESFDLVRDKFNAEGPFDGLLGFSQGAAFAVILCNLLQRKNLSYGFKFVILISAFKSRSSLHKEFYDLPITIPSLHIYGENDQIITKSMSEELLKNFDHPKVIVHEGGHYMAASPQLKTHYLDFIKSVNSHV